MSSYANKNSGVDQVDNVQYKSIPQLQDRPQSQEESNADTLASQGENEALGQRDSRSSKELPLIQEEHQNKVHSQGAYNNHKKGVNKNSERDTKFLDIEANGKITKHQDSRESNPAASEDTNCCVFCLDGGELIHMCSCSVVTHKECALDYIRFPGNMNENCCQCRRKLEYDVLDEKTPMRPKYLIAFLLMILVYMTIIGLSVYGTILLIPQGDKNIYLWIAIIGNLSILWPLIIVFLFTSFLGCCSAYRYRRSDSSPDICGGTNCNCDGGCGDCGSCDAGGEGCVMIICVICLLIIFAVLIAASAYLFFSLFKFYKSFSLNSKKEIVFKHEGRRINTLG